MLLIPPYRTDLWRQCVLSTYAQRNAGLRRAPHREVARGGISLNL